MARNKDRGKKPLKNHQVTLKCAGCQKELHKVMLLTGPKSLVAQYCSQYIDTDSYDVDNFGYMWKKREKICEHCGHILDPTKFTITVKPRTNNEE